MFALFLIAVALLGYTTWIHSFLGSLATYLAAGATWRWHHLAVTPPTYFKRSGAVGFGPPAGISGSIVGIIMLWPIHAAVMAYIFLGRLRAPKRFLVVCGEEQSYFFDSWGGAVEFARRKARELAREISIHDDANWERSHYGDMHASIRWVLPSGELRKKLPPISLERWSLKWPIVPRSE